MDFRYKSVVFTFLPRFAAGSDAFWSFPMFWVTSGIRYIYLYRFVYHFIIAYGLRFPFQTIFLKAAILMPCPACLALWGSGAGLCYQLVISSETLNLLLMRLHGADMFPFVLLSPFYFGLALQSLAWHRFMFNEYICPTL